MSSQGRKRTLYVGGLEESVTEEIVFAAFIPFGDIKEVSLPKDFGDKTKSMKHKGFAFVEFEEAEDAQEAMDNMEGAELCGKVIRCSFAKPMTAESSGTGAHKAIWTTEEFLAKEQEEAERKAMAEAGSEQ